MRDDLDKPIKYYTRVCKRCGNVHRTTSKTSGAICENCKIFNKRNSLARKPGCQLHI